jgi:hypothetical protein
VEEIDIAGSSWWKHMQFRGGERAKGWSYWTGLATRLKGIFSGFSFVFFLVFLIFFIGFSVFCC